MELIGTLAATLADTVAVIALLGAILNKRSKW